MPPGRPEASLLERDEQLGLLADAWRQTRRGRGSVWLICAEAGGGKTRLMREVARAADASVRWGAADPLSPPEPYQAAIAAVPGLEPAATRSATIERAIERLAADGGANPALVVLDDLHFADEGTVALLVRLAAECVRRPWLVLAAFRPGEEPDALRLAAVEMEAQGAARRLDLPPLSRSAVRALVSRVGGPEAGAAADAIFEDSGGNPWLAESLARGGASVSVVRNRLVLRLDRLEAANPGALDLLRALAPTIRPVPHSLVADLRGGDTPPLRRALAELRDAGLLAETDGGWQFRHEILRRSLLEAMIGAERRDAHRALAAALERHGGGAAELAMHFAEAADARAVEWALRAAREARAVDAHAEALGQVERALTFDLDAETRRSALMQAEQECYDLGRWEDGLRYIEAALAVPGAPPETTASMHQMAAREAHHCGDYARDEAHLEEAERILADRPPSREKLSIALARANRAAIYALPDELPERAGRALALAEQIDDAGARLRATTQVQGFLATARVKAGDPGGFPVFQESIAEAMSPVLPAGVAGSLLTNAYQEAVLQLFHEEAGDLYPRAIDWIERHEIGWHDHINSHRVLELAQRGRYEDARALRRRVGDLRHMDAYFQIVIDYADLLLEARAGSPERARAPLPELTGQIGYQDLFRDFVRLEQATSDAPGPGVPELAERVYDLALRRQEARIAGTAAVALARAGSTAPDLPAWLVPQSPLRVLWQWASGIATRDAAELRVVAERLTAMACPYEAAMATRDAGDLTAAYRRLRDLEATTAREQTAVMLRAGGLPVPRRTRAATAPGGLTDTEMAVARLAAGGATNDEVAAALGISAFTVATHLTHVYAKLAVRGRAALASWWSRQERTADGEGTLAG